VAPLSLIGCGSQILAEIYIEALHVNEEAADQVWEAWDKGEIDDQPACIAWVLIAGVSSIDDRHSDNSRAS